MKKILAISSILIFTASVFAQPGLNARSMGMAGAYGCMARGSEVIQWNPANLGFPSRHQLDRMASPHPYWPVNPDMSFDLASFAVSIGNNSLNLDLYNEYFTKSYFEQHDVWDDEAKDQILSAFDDELRGFNNLRLTELALSYQRFAFSISSFSYTSLMIPQNLLTVPLQGLGTDPLPLDFEGEMIAATEIAFSTSKVLYEWDYFDYFALGATFKYFIGHAYFSVDDADGTVLSNEDTLSVNGTYKILTAFPFDDRGKGGDGVGLDLGAAAIVGENLTLGVSFNNLVGSINFGEVEEGYGSIALNESGLSQDEFDHFGEYIDSVAVTTDTTYISPEIIRYKLPKSLNFSASYQLNPWLLVEADYQQGLNNTAGGTTIPRLALGTEITKLKILPLRFGFALGGIQGTTIATGFGLRLGAFQLDFAMAGQRGLFNGSKGINFAISPRLTF